MDKRRPEVAFSEELGFGQLDPIPTRSELEEFYGEEYFSANPGRAPDVKRLVEEGSAGDAERRWRSETIYADVAHYLESAVPASIRVVDVGSGSGEFVIYGASRDGWAACGIELSPDAVAIAQERGADVARGTIHDVADIHGTGFDALTMFNVLEHVPDPVETIRAAHRLLRSGGLLVVQVPNDYSILQEAVREYLAVEPWWIAVPDHINYFDFESLERTLVRNGFETMVRYGTYPMEFFLVSGIDYLGDRQAGSTAHRRRCDFEMAMNGERRRELCEQLGRAGIGRNAVLVAKRTAV